MKDNALSGQPLRHTLYDKCKFNTNFFSPLIFSKKIKDNLVFNGSLKKMIAEHIKYSWLVKQPKVFIFYKGKNFYLPF